jgi:hypothetical protein
MKAPKKAFENFGESFFEPEALPATFHKYFSASYGTEKL